jgi:hypothetical protein
MVVMQQATQDVPAMNNTILAALRFRNRDLLLKPLVWAGFVVEGHVLDPDPAQMRFAHNQKAVQTLLSQRDRIQSGSQGALLRLSPLRTGLESFQSSGSSLSNAR